MSDDTTASALADVAALRAEIGAYAVQRLIRNVTSTAKKVDEVSDHAVRDLERRIMGRLDRIEAALTGRCGHPDCNCVSGPTCLLRG